MKGTEKKEKKEKKPEIKIELPDLGLSQDQLDELAKGFENSLVATLNENVAHRPRQRKIRFPPKTITQVREPPLQPIPVRRHPPKHRAPPSDEPNE
jgi:hypothetical protein